MPVESIDLRQISQADAQAIGQLLATVWPNPKKTAEYRKEQILAVRDIYAGTDLQAPLSFLVREDDRIIAHAAILPRAIATSAGEMEIAGLARVCTDPQIRGRGLGEVVVQAAFEPIDRGDFPFSLFQTSPEVRPFYERQGACIVENKIVNSLGENLEECPFWDKAIMRYPASSGWPAGEIDLRGPGY